MLQYYEYGQTAHLESILYENQLNSNIIYQNLHPARPKKYTIALQEIV